MPRLYRHIPTKRAIVAKCSQCGEKFTWLPDNFDMKHRFNKETHEWCGGRIVEPEDDKPAPQLAPQT